MTVLDSAEGRSCLVVVCFEGSKGPVAVGSSVAKVEAEKEGQRFIMIILEMLLYHCYTWLATVTYQINMEMSNYNRLRQKSSLNKNSATCFTLHGRI